MKPQSLLFRSGDTIERHNDKFNQADAKLREVFSGDTIAIDDHMKFYYIASLELFEVFSTNVRYYCYYY